MEIKVGQVWFLYDNPSTQVKVVFIGRDTVVFDHLNKDYEGCCSLKGFLESFSLKKPEPILKKLVAWVHVNGDFACFSFDNKNGHHDWTKKELIVKDGSLYVDMSEVGE